jgi:hypothetical protein
MIEIRSKMFLCMALVLGPANHAIANGCTAGELSRSEVDGRFKTEMQSLLTASLKARGQDNIELFKSIGPPASSGGSRLVDGASFTDVLAIAVENQFLKESDGQTSLQITPFAWKAAFDPDIVNDPSRYNTRGNTLARRFALTFTTGGTGEKFDRDSDGTADAPLKADDFSDIQAWELKFRLFGSRDWKENLDQLVKDAGDPAPSAMEFARLNLSMAQAGVVDPARPHCVKENLFVTYVESAAAQKILLDLATLRSNDNAKLKKLFAEITTRWTGSLVAATTQQEPDFGQDKWSVGLRISKGGDRKSINLNADYAQANGRGMLPDPNSWKLGAEYVRYFFAGKLGAKGAKTSFSATWQMFDDIPDAEHDDIGKIGVRMEFPIAGSKSVKLPVSVIWANHEDVLTDADSIRAHIGFTVDFGEALKKSE